MNPRDLKRRLAREIVTLYHDGERANEAEAHFDKVIVSKDLPDEMPEVRIAKPVWIGELLKENGLVKSTSEARRLIEQGAVSINGERIEDASFSVMADAEQIIKVGKRRFLKVLPD